jgi:hypothetical protein
MPIQVEVLNSLYNFYYHSLQELWLLDNFKNLLTQYINK